MLEGITVLNQGNVMQSVIPTWMWVALVIIGVVGWAGMFICMEQCTEVGTVISCCGWMGALLIALVIGIANPQESTGRYRYECLIDETVSMTEVYERYEVIEQRGDIWVLEDKE